MHRKRWGEIWIVPAILAGACTAQVAGQGSGCASTPAAAIEAARSAPTVTVSPARGYRVESVRWDAVQRRTWAVIRSCDHAERPTLAVLTDLPPVTAAAVITTPSSVAVPAAPTISAQTVLINAALLLVHAGDVVRLWRADVQAHIELVAAAEENGAIGAKVRLRLITSKEPDGQYAPPKYIAGIVRGPADVEMEQ